MQRGQGKGTCSLHTKEKACSCLMLEETLLTLLLWLPGWDNDGLWFELGGFCYFAVQPWKMSIVGEESESWDLGFQRARMWVPVTHGAPLMWWMKTAKRPAVTAVYLEHVGEDLDTQIRCCNCPSPGGLCLNVLLGKRKCLKKKKTTGCEHFVCLLQLCAFLLPMARVCNCQRPWLSVLSIFPVDVPVSCGHSLKRTHWPY